MRVSGYLFPLTCAALLITAAVSCVKPPDYPIEPEIEYIGLNRTVFSQSNFRDTIAVTFFFTDGDGDLGTPDDDSTNFDVFLTDSRDGFVRRFRLPTLPDEGIGNGVSGEATVRIPNRGGEICCTYPDGSDACRPNPRYPTDTMSFFIQIRDRAGHFSNMVKTEQITILCQ